MLPAEQRLFTDEQLWDMEQRFERIAYHAPPIPTRSPWAPLLAANAPKPRVPYEIVFRKPNPGEAQKFRASSNDKARIHQAQEDLGRATVIGVAIAPKDASAPPLVYVCDASPDPKIAAKAPREALDRLLIEYPLACDAAAGKLGDLAGLARDESEKD